MKTTEYENGVLICSKHRTPISKRNGKFFCVKCNRTETATKKQQSTYYKMLRVKVLASDAQEYSTKLADTYQQSGGISMWLYSARDIARKMIELLDEIEKEIQ